MLVYLLKLMIFHRLLYICQRVFQNHTLTNSPGDALGIPDLDETITAAGHKQPLVLGAPKKFRDPQARMVTFVDIMEVYFMFYFI